MNNKKAEKLLTISFAVHFCMTFAILYIVGVLFYINVLGGGFSCKTVNTAASEAVSGSQIE